MLVPRGLLRASTQNFVALLVLVERLLAVAIASDKLAIYVLPH